MGDGPVHVDLKALEERLRANQLKDEPTLDRPRRYLHESVEAPLGQEESPQEERRWSGWPPPFETKVRREINAEIWVGYTPGKKDPTSFWVGREEVHPIEEVLDRVRLGKDFYKFKVRTDTGLFIISRRGRRWTLEKELEPI